MTRFEMKDKNCTTYTYNVKDLMKKEVLALICDILRDDDIQGHGLILTQPLEEKDWPGITKEIPYNPVAAEFAEDYENVPLTCVTAIMEYHGQSMMLSYHPEQNLLSVILPAEFTADINEIEQNVIPDVIDQNPEEEPVEEY